MIDIWKGVESLLDSYAQINKKDLAVILYTLDALEPAVWVSAALEQRGISYARVWMKAIQDHGLESRLLNALPEQSALDGRLVLISLERDTMSHTTTIRRALENYRTEDVIVLRAISAGPEFFSVSLLPTPQEIESRNTYLLERMSRASLLKITTPGGSDFNVRLKPGKHRWISNRGKAIPGRTVILPAGEVATYPASVDGYFIADFAYNVNEISERDVRLTDTPVHLLFEGGNLIELECDNKDTREYLTNIMSMNEHGRRAGELGFGTNFAIERALPMNSHINERCPGDLIAYGGLVWADG
jgi:leucyl aminopeptidase (aminopeptidase T)